MIDTGKANILEEKTVQDIVNYSKDALSHLNDTNSKTVYYVLKDTEGKILEALENIKSIAADDLAEYEFLKKIYMTAKELKDKNTGKKRKLSDSDRKKELDNLRANFLHNSNVFTRAERNWNEALNYLRKDILPIVENVAGLAADGTPKDTAAPKYTPKEITVMACYPNFETHYKFLIDNGYMAKNGNSLKWQKSKQALAEYFNWIKPKDKKNMSWKCVENLFGEKDLRVALSSNGIVYKNNSKDFQELKKIFEQRFNDL